MTQEITFKRGRFTSTIFKLFQGYYRKQGVDDQYITLKWNEWGREPSVHLLKAAYSNKVLGWIVYDKKTSTVEEILSHDPEERKDNLGAMLDALVDRESLIAVSLLKKDTVKNDFFLNYGFRPTRSFKKNGFDIIRMDLSTSVLMQKMIKGKPFRAWRKKERVAIEKIPGTQTYDEIKRGVAVLIDRLGGLGKFVKPGQTVAIKPNIVSDHGLKEGQITGGIVTDIRLVRALTELLLPVASKVFITEGSSINRSETTKMFRHYGYDEIVALDPDRVSLVDLNTDRLVEKQIPGGKRMTSRKVPVTLETVDTIISVPVMKIHFAATVSLSIKNLQGAMPPLEKYMSHFFGLWQSLVNISHLVKPKLIIVDGLTGSEDFGPISGTPKKMDVLIGGTNPVAVDAVAMRVMGLDPATSPPVFLAYMQGLGPIENEKISIVGAPVEEVAQRFKQPDIDTTGGTHLSVYADDACPGCKGYLHFVLSKLRKPDPQDTGRFIIDRPFEKKVNIFLGPTTKKIIDPDETNIFLGICQQHNTGSGTHLPGCPPHAEVIMNGIFSLFPDIERPKYSDETEESKLGKMLDEILNGL